MCRLFLSAAVFCSASLFALPLSHSATRIISLSPDLTETLFAIGVGDRIVGVMKGCDYPAAAKHIPVVANYVAMNAEAILSLHPDLIVAWDVGQTRTQLDFFKKLGIPVYLTHPNRITDVAETITRLGYLTGASSSANLLAQQYLRRYADLQKHFAHAKPVSVFYEVWNRPLMTIGKDSWINEIISLCGGRNVFAHLNAAVPTIDPEAVIRADPEVIFALDDYWRNWSGMKAVRNNQLKHVSPDILERPGPRLIEGAEVVCSILSQVPHHK